MPIARFEMPDGSIGRFEIPEGMDPAEAEQQIQSMIQESEPKPDPKREYFDTLRNGVQPSTKGDTIQEDTLDVLGEFAHSINVGVPQLLDMPSHLVNWMLKKAGVNARIPATMEKNFNKATGFPDEGFMDPGTPRDIVRGAGQLTAAGVGLVPVQRAAGTLGSAVMDLAGAGTTAAIQPAKTGLMVAGDAVNNLPAILPGERKARELAELPLLRQTGDVQSAGYRLNELGKVVPDAAQRSAMKQGLQPKLVSMVNSMTPKGKEKARLMLDRVQGSMDNMLNQNKRPGDIVGDSILNRAKVVYKANRAAGMRLKPEVEKLKGATVDVNPAVDTFLGHLDEMGVKFDPKKGSLDFSGSDIDELSGPENAIKKLLSRMIKVDKVDAYEAHRLKKYIDEVVTYGKKAEGLSGKTANIMKEMRHDINTILGESFPEYGRVNKQYSETIEALDALQDIGGKRMDLLGENADRALGVLSRRVHSNAVSGVPLDDALNQLDEVAKKYVTKGGTDIVPYGVISKSSGVTLDDLDDSLQAQMLFASEMERFFGSAAPNSFQGSIEKAGEVAANLSTGGAKSAIGEFAKGAYDRVRGINEENALKALRQLLAE